mmetsp:Transcript_12145/g.25638  ORF Transcript_12145/g.25638 Transcript_12145/m.25638 type:complete len:82 (+) Transcript_12145:276-521(+)
MQNNRRQRQKPFCRSSPPEMEPPPRKSMCPPRAPSSTRGGPPLPLRLLLSPYGSLPSVSAEERPSCSLRPFMRGVESVLGG